MIASLVIGIISFGIRYSFGIFFNSLETYFGLSRAATSGIFSIHLLFGGVVSVVGGWALDKYGPKKVALTMCLFTGLSLLTSSQVRVPWQLYITYSVLLGLGTGALFTIVNSTATRWFVKKRGLVVGITSAAGSLGGVVMAPFSSLLLLHFDWRMSFIILGAMAWIILIPVSQLMKREPGDIGLMPDGMKPEASPIKSFDARLIQQDGFFLYQAYKVREFWFLALAWLFSGMSSQMVITHAVPHAIDLGISPIDAAFIISLVGVGSILGRIIDGRLSDTIGRKSLAIMSALIQAAALISLIFIQQLWMIYIFGLFFGYGWGGLGTQLTLLVGDIYGLRSIGTIMGTITSAWNIGAAIGPFIGGVVFDTTGTYSAAFAIAAFGMILATVFSTLIRPLRGTASGT